MKPEVLERNLRLLLRRGYVPALPAPRFRDRLEGLFLSELALRARGPRGRAHSMRLLVALAAASLVLFLGWRLVAGSSAPTRAGLLARHAVALGLADGSWRAADEEERFHGVHFRPPALVAVTPENVELDVLLGVGRVHLAQDSEVRFATRGTAWPEKKQLEEGQVEATLRAGSASFVFRGDSTPLALGETLLLRPAPASDSNTPVEVVSRTGREVRPTLPAPAKPETSIPSGRFLAGRVVMAENGEPAQRFSVALLREYVENESHPPERREFDSPDGSFLWPDPPGGKQRVFVHAEGHALCALGEFDLSHGSRELEVRLEVGLSLRGSVLDSAGNPVAGALVISENDAPTDALLLQHADLAYWLPIQARTGPDGRFELAHLHPGLQNLRASAAELAPAWVSALRLPAPGREVTFTLNAGGTVEGFVSREDGNPWPGAEIVIVAMDHVERGRMTLDLTRTDIDGRYRFANLPPTTMIVVLLRDDNRPEVRPVQVAEGQVLTADFEAQKHGIHLHGRLLDQDGTPIAGQNLGLFERKDSNWNQHWVATTTLADGSFDFDGVEPGGYLLYVIDKLGRSLRCVDRVDLEQGQVDIEHDVYVPAGRIAVRVHDAADGKGVEQTAVIALREDERGGTEFAAFGLTEPDGWVRMGELHAGTYHLSAYPSRPGLSYVQGDPVLLGLDESVELELALEVGGAVDVLVRSDSGQALEGALVTFFDESGQQRQFSRQPLTGADGRYHANGLRPGRYRLAVRLDGYQSTPVTFQFELGRELEIPVLLTPNPSAEERVDR